MHNIAVVCVDYNGWEHTQKLCASLEKQDGRGSDFMLTCVVVDNSTCEESSHKLRATFAERDWIRYRRADRNVGYFGGLNVGLGELNFDEWDFVVICNNDLEFREDFCKRLLSGSYSPNVYSICPDVTTVDGLKQNPHVMRPIGWLRRLQFDLYFSHYFVAKFLSLILRVVRPVRSSRAQPDSACEIHMGIGAIYVLTREFLSRFNKLSYPHFLYGEEAFFSDQIHSAGGVLWFDPDLSVRHAESAATSKVPRREIYEFAREGYLDYRKML